MTGALSHSPAIRAVEVPLRPPDYPPEEPSYELGEDELREAEAVRAEGCGELCEVE